VGVERFEYGFDLRGDLKRKKTISGFQEPIEEMKESASKEPT